MKNETSRGAPSIISEPGKFTGIPDTNPNDPSAENVIQPVNKITIMMLINFVRNLSSVFFR